MYRKSIFIRSHLPCATQNQDLKNCEQPQRHHIINQNTKKVTSFVPSGAHVSPPTPPSQEHNSVTAEWPQSSCPSQESPSFLNRSDASYGAPRAGTSQLEAASQGSRHERLQLELIPDTAQSIQFAMKGNIYGLKQLFSQGLASPRDVSHSRGFNLVRWALYGGMCNYKTVQFLLSCGAFVDEESYEYAWDYAYRNKCSSTELAELQCITMDSHGLCKYRDWGDEQQFPLIHQIVFPRSSKPLSDELDDNPDAVRLTEIGSCERYRINS